MTVAIFFIIILWLNIFEAFIYIFLDQNEMQRATAVNISWL
jgi:hypothetical protein